MSLLDRLKPQPRWRHPDPAVRLAAVADLDDAAHLMAIAREDTDAAVRRAAVRRLADAGFLASVAREDPDERVREAAAAGLLELALEGETDESAAAVEGLTDPRHLAQVARQARHAGARLRALERLTDPRALGSVARHAGDPDIARRALAALDDESEIIDVAINSEHKDVALAALEAVATRAPEARTTFETVAARAKHKAVARRAAGLVQAIDEAKAAEAERQARLQALVDAVQALETAVDWRAADATLASSEANWRAIGEVPPELAARFEAACARARAAIAARREEALAAERREALRAAERAPREALCARAEGLAAAGAAPETADALLAIRAEWAALAPAVELDPTEQDALAARFAAAVAAVEDAVRRFQAGAEARAKLEALSQEAEALADAADLDQALARWAALGDAWRTLREAAGVVPAEVEARFAKVGERLAARDAERTRQQEQAKRDNVARLVQLCTHLEARVGAEDLKLREADRGLRQVRAALEALPPLPTREDEHRMVERLKALQARLVPRVRELRELDDWKRFANAAAQEQLIAQMEALKAETDLDKAARALRDLHARWREVAEAPRDQAEALWRRFKAASDEIRARCSDFFAQRAAERAENLRRKEEICARAEALADSTDWIRTAEELKRLQAEWKTIGPVSRKHAKVVWQRFRAACDRFFTRRHEDLVQRKQMWAANLERKLALCAQAEALADSTDWDQAAAEIRRLQAEWRTIGPVRKNKSEVVWQRFRTACDRFFERYKHRHQIDLSARLAEREALVAEAEALWPADGTPPSEEAATQALALWSRWSRLATMPRELLEPFQSRFTGVLARLIEQQPERFRGTPLDPEANRKKMEALCLKVERHLAAATEITATASASPSTLLAERLREALAANTIGGRSTPRLSEDARWRQAADEVKEAQAAWRRLGPVPGEAGRALQDRFGRACQRFFDLYRRRRVGQPGAAAATGSH
jgi:hypothetical protein